MKPSKHEIVRLKHSAARVSRLAARLAPRPRANGRAVAYLTVGSITYPCSLGRSGLTRRKQEGDGATPIGSYRVLGWRFRPVCPGFLRAGRLSGLIRRDHGWCDDPTAGAYNKPIRLPARASHERLWRADGKYDVVGILDYNVSCRKKGAGSAIFFHICDDDFGPTEGCIAIRARDMRKILPRLARQVSIIVG